MSRPISRKGLIRKLDDLFRQIIRLRDNYTCQRCGTKYPEKAQGLDTAHFISRRNHHVRWVEDNAALLDTGCHMSWAHYKPREYEDWFRKRLGEEMWAKLIIQKNSTSRLDLQMIRFSLELRSKELEERQ